MIFKYLKKINKNNIENYTNNGLIQMFIKKFIKTNQLVNK